MADTATVSDAKQWCETARKLLGLGIFSADGRALSNRAAKTAESLKQLQKAVASGNIPLSPAMLKHYEHQFIAIAKDTEAAARKGDKDEVDRQSDFLKELRLELAIHRAKDGEERAKARKALEEQQQANLDRDRAASGKIDETYEREKAAYENAKVKTLPQIEAVADDGSLAVIGGSAVKSQLDKALGLARQEKWKEARLALEIAYGNAELVEKRKPYIEARRAHEANIKAAMGIDFPKPGKTYGERLTKLWERAQKLADSGAFEKAAAMIDTAAKMIEKEIDENDELKEKRGEVMEARKENVAEMNAILESAEPDIEELRKLARKELQDYAKQATQLGVDPGAPSREVCEDWDGAERTFKRYDWFALKDQLHNQEITKDQMWDLWRYRQKYVTDLIDSLRKKYPSLIAKAAGSADLESDIDITFASATPGDEVKAAQDFNAKVISKFSKPAGRVFDVNIYPRDYRAISESFNPDFNPDHIPDRDIDHPAGEMGKLSQVDQDVATLLKQRRFLDQETFQGLLDKVLEAAPNEKVADKIRKQYEEGEDIYLLTSVEKVDAIIATLTKKNIAIADHPETAKAYKTFLDLRQKVDAGGITEMARMQRLLPNLLDALEAAFEAEVMETTDAMYLDRMAKLRGKQSTIAVLGDDKAGIEEHHPGKSCKQAHPKDKDHDAWRKARGEALMAQVKKDQFENIIFANEAYMSQGAIEHIVAGIQAKKADPRKAKEVIDSLTPATVLQSVNEQMADFFKDMKHAEHEVAKAKEKSGEAAARRATGEAFVHASKYLVRLLDGAQLLVDKHKGLKFDLIEKNASVKTPNDLKGKVEEMLYALRKSAEIPAAVKGEVGVDEVHKLFGVTDIEGFRRVIFDFGADVNAKVRGSKAFIKAQNIEEKTEEQYFANV